MKTWQKVVLGIVVIMAVVIGVGAIQFNKFIKESTAKVEAIHIETVDLSKVADGDFVGDCDTGAIYAKVKVQVKSGKIVNIDILEHKNGKGGPAEIIVDQIASQQSLDVDNISGATGSSRVIKKAVEVALKKGIQ